MKFDLIISNPPYGKIGANITKNIIDNVKFNQYINLLPANDYKRNNDHDLYNYQSDMININDGFKDAAVTTHIAKIYDHKINDYSLEQFERSCYLDRSLDKYFEENSKREHYAIDVALCGFDTHEYDVHKSFILGLRDISHKHLPYSTNCTSYKWNVEESIDYNYLLHNHWVKSLHFTGGISFSAIEFRSQQEKSNFSTFCYSKDGFRFLSKIFTSVNVDGTIFLGKIFPKVDWSHSWTVEQILADYGYTESEIKEVMDDLVNFKGMKEYFYI